MTIKVAAIIQARMGSTRLPGKTLTQVGGKPLLQHLIERVRASRFVEDVIIATTTKARDDVLVEFAEKLGLSYFRGSEEDVLDRIYQAAQHYAVQHIVRVTPDCPLLDSRVMDSVIEAYLSGQYDYVSNNLRYTYPDGLDVEVFSFQALERAWKEARLPSEREHVTPYIRNSGHFRLFNVESGVDLSQFKWSVDTENDLAFVRAVFERLQDKGNIFPLEGVVLLLRNNRELAAINHQSIINEGYYKSLSNDPPVPSHQVRLNHSYALKEKAQALIPSCTQTFSKGPTQFVQGVAPVFLQRGQGSHVWDVDGNEYIDYPMALAPVILGHNYPSVTEAAVRQMQDGVSFSLTHPLEVKLAETLVDLIPCAEMVRFGKNGSDATSGAVRVARAYTGRDIIACCGYHGWQDWYIGTTTRNKGVPRAVQELTIPFQYNDIASLERIFDQHPRQVAAVIMEPVGVVEPREGFLQRVRDLAHREGALFVFDEVITGFRLALGGAQEYFGVVPDLACFGKAMGNGFPISAVVGRKEIMELFDEIFFSFTFGGEAVSLAASLATINEMREKKVILHLWEQGRKLKDGYNVLSQEFEIQTYTQCIGLPPRTVMSFKDNTGAESLVLKSLFQQECLKRGILTAGYHNLCYSHSDKDIDYTLRVYRTVLEILSQAIREGDVLERLEGAPVQSVFRQA
jgi:glutamate-1-semialdehyde 2,1-aminomutase/spore coat polysaccharide biosynthesis protein SpsF